MKSGVSVCVDVLGLRTDVSVCVGVYGIFADVLCVGVVCVGVSVWCWWLRSDLLGWWWPRIDGIVWWGGAQQLWYGLC